MVWLHSDAMSWSDIKPYFRQRVADIDPKKTLKEWTDAFNVDNVPANVLEERFHIEVGQFGQNVQNQNVLESVGYATVTLFRRGHKEPQKAVDSLIEKSQALIVESLRAKNRVTQPGIKNVKLSNFDLVPIAASNDNTVKAIIIFELTIFIAIPE